VAPASATLLAFDYGTHCIGVAIGSPLTRQARALASVRVSRAGQPDWAALTRLIEAWQPRALLVGLPLNMDGTPTARTAAARKFGNRLKARYNLPVDMVDERLTTVLARQSLREAGVSGTRQKPRLDSEAARLILQSYLDESPKADA